MAQPFTDMLAQLERAARNGTKAHLSADLARALITSPAYPLLLAERTKELTNRWQEEPLHTIPSPAPGAPASDLVPVPRVTRDSHINATDEAVERAERRRLLAAIDTTAGPRKRQKTPSPTAK